MHELPNIHTEVFEYTRSMTSKQISLKYNRKALNEKNVCTQNIFVLTNYAKSMWGTVKGYFPNNDKKKKNMKILVHTEFK